MKNKFLTISLASSILALTSFTAEAGQLTISNNSNVEVIAVRCNHMPGEPLKKGKTFSRDWRTIKAILGSSSKGSCEFFDALHGNKHLGAASLQINASTTGAKITSFETDADAPIHAVIDAQIGEERENITVNVVDL